MKTMMSANNMAKENLPTSTVSGPISEETAYKIWAKAVDTQMHFNEMSVKSRQLGLTFVAAALGLAIVLVSQGKDYFMVFAIGTWPIHIHVSVPIVVAAAFAVYAVRMMDVGVYHKMLRGAVAFGEDFEELHIRPRIQLQKGMTQAISHFSRHEDAAVKKSGPAYVYEGTRKVTALDKIKMFYRNVILGLIIAAVLIFFATQPHVISANSPESSKADAPSTN